VDLHVPRGQTASELEGCISSGASAEKFSSVKKALITLKNDDNLSGNVIIAGSFFTVSDALTVFGKEG
jgi:dihydrofolate synthase/folylpolyglutamate synthase